MFIEKMSKDFLVGFSWFSRFLFVIACAAALSSCLSTAHIVVDEKTKEKRMECKTWGFGSDITRNCISAADSVLDQKRTKINATGPDGSTFRSEGSAMPRLEYNHGLHPAHPALQK